MRTVCKTNKCVGCHACEELCPKNAIRIEDQAEYMNAVIDEATCIDCKICDRVCQVNYPLEKKSQVVCVKYGLKIVRIKLLNKNMIGVLTGCMGIVCVCRVALSFNDGAAIQLISAVVTSGIVYGLILILFRNEIAWTILRKVCRTHEK